MPGQVWSWVIAATEPSLARPLRSRNRPLQQMGNQVAQAAPLISSPLFKAVNKVPGQSGADPGRLAAEQFRCGHRNAGSPLGAEMMSHQFNHELDWSRGQAVTAALASPQSYAALRRSGLVVLQMCCIRVLRTPKPWQ